MNKNDVLIELKKVNVKFAKKGGFFDEEKFAHVLKDIDLTLNRGEILALVGESGCGKTTLGKVITGLIKAEGEVLFEGQPIGKYRNAVQFVQQDSYAALNPARTVYQSLYAAIKHANKKSKKAELDEKLGEIMSMVELVPAEQYLAKFPHQLSGGQRQRALMARAICLNPKLIVADEPVSMIDVSLRISLLNLMKSLRDRLNVSFLYITHDLSTARLIADGGRICVMYLGEIVEIGNIDDVLNNPKHPYTAALIKAVPLPDPELNGEDELPLKSMDLQDLTQRGEGCSFYTRCLYGEEACLSKVELQATESGFVRCTKYKGAKL